MVDGVSHSTNLSDPRLHVNRHAKETVKARRLYSISELSGNLDLGVNNADISTYTAGTAASKWVEDLCK